MIDRGIEWFEKKAFNIWRNEPAKSILTIVPNGNDADQITHKINCFIEKNFIMRDGDEDYATVVLSIRPDKYVSAKHLVEDIVKQSEKYLKSESSARSEEYLTEKMETAFADLLNNKLYPILLIKRFHSLTRLNDGEILPILESLREFEREKKVTSIIISPMNYDVIRHKMKENDASSMPFLNSPYGDNHEKIVAEPLQNKDFVDYAKQKGICEDEANNLFTTCGGPDKIYEVLVQKKLYGARNLIDECLEECTPIFNKLIEHCQIENNSEILTRLVSGELLDSDEDHLASKDLKEFLIKKQDKNFSTCSSEILHRFICLKLSDIKKHVFERSIKELLVIDEDQEIEFKETFFTATRSHDGNDINRDVIKKAAIKEITGFLNSNDGTLLIGVADRKNTETKNPEARGIENDYLKSIHLSLHRYLVALATQL